MAAKQSDVPPPPSSAGHPPCHTLLAEAAASPRLPAPPPLAPHAHPPTTAAAAHATLSTTAHPPPHLLRLLLVGGRRCGLASLLHYCQNVLLRLAGRLALQQCAIALQTRGWVGGWVGEDACLGGGQVSEKASCAELNRSPHPDTHPPLHTCTHVQRGEGGSTSTPTHTHTHTVHYCPPGTPAAG